MTISEIRSRSHVGGVALTLAEARYCAACERVGAATATLFDALTGLPDAPSSAAIEAAARRVAGTVSAARNAAQAVVRAREARRRVAYTPPQI